MKHVTKKNNVSQKYSNNTAMDLLEVLRKVDLILESMLLNEPIEILKVSMMIRDAISRAENES